MKIEESDLAEDAQANLTSDNFTVTRAWMVSEFGGISGSAKVISAINADGVARFGEKHPQENAIQVVGISAKPVDSDIIKVVCNYDYAKQDDKPPNNTGQMDVSVSTTLQEITTNFDAKGNLIVVRYSRKITDETTGEIRTQVDKQIGEIKVQIPLTVLRLSRKEPSDPRIKSQIYSGKINSSGIFGDPAKYWLCKSITGDSKDGQKTFDVVYEFQRNPNTWDATVIYIDPDTGKPPEDITDDNGNILQIEAIRDVEAYLTIEFRNLNIVAKGL